MTAIGRGFLGPAADRRLRFPAVAMLLVLGLAPLATLKAQGVDLRVAPSAKAGRRAATQPTIPAAEVPLEDSRVH